MLRAEASPLARVSVPLAASESAPSLRDSSRACLSAAPAAVLRLPSPASPLLPLLSRLSCLACLSCPSCLSCLSCRCLRFPCTACCFFFSLGSACLSPVAPHIGRSHSAFTGGVVMTAGFVQPACLVVSPAGALLLRRRVPLDQRLACSSAFRAGCCPPQPRYRSWVRSALPLAGPCLPLLQPYRLPVGRAPPPFGWAFRACSGQCILATAVRCAVRLSFLRRRLRASAHGRALPLYFPFLLASSGRCRPAPRFSPAIRPRSLPSPPRPFWPVTSYGGWHAVASADPVGVAVVRVVPRPQRLRCLSSASSCTVSPVGSSLSSNSSCTFSCVHLAVVLEQKHWPLA